MAIYRNTVWSQAFQITANAVAVNITGWTFACSFRLHAADADPPLFTLTTGDGITITDAVNGRFTMQISEIRSLLLPVGHIVFDIMRTDTGESQRLCGGRDRVRQAVTRV